MIPVVVNFFVWFLVWVGLSWPVTVKEIVIGAVVSGFVSYMTIDVFKGHRAAREARGGRGIADLIKLPARVFWFLVYTAVFLWECLRANIDVAWRVLHPDMPIRPGTIRIKTSLTSDAALTFLANSITLTPGTTTVDIDRDRGFIYVHWLYVRGESGQKDRLPLVTRFERILKRIFE